MKKIIAFLFAIILMISCAATVCAADESREFFFELSVDGSDQKKVQTGDIITVVYTLYRKDSQENYDMYAMQNEIRYDSTFFRMVEGSAMLADGISTTDIGLRDTYREFYMNFVSLSGGESWSARQLIGSFQLEVIGTSGVTQITNQDYLVSTADGKDSYKATCQDITVVLSTDCTVSFETNGGTKIEECTVQYGEYLTRPEDPVREGYQLEGWYTDLDLKNPWNFETDPVQGNLTLYAKWTQGTGTGDNGGSKNGPGNWWWILLLILLFAGILGVILFMLLNTRTVKFETNCKTNLPDQKVKKGGYAERPQQPERSGRTFAGWFYDAECTERWDFEEDTVQENMTLYAKWL